MKHLNRLDQVQAKELVATAAWSAGLVESTEHWEKGMRTLLFQSLARDRWSPCDIRERPGRACTRLPQTLDTVSIFLGRCSFSAHPWDYAEVGEFSAWERPQDSYKLFYERGFEIPEPAGGGSLFDSALLGRQECIRIGALGTPEIVGSEREPQGRIPELGLGSFSIKNKLLFLPWTSVL